MAASVLGGGNGIRQRGPDHRLPAAFLPGLQNPPHRRDLYLSQPPQSEPSRGGGRLLRDPSTSAPSPNHRHTAFTANQLLGLGDAGGVGGGAGGGAGRVGLGGLGGLGGPVAGGVPGTCMSGPIGPIGPIGPEWLQQGEEEVPRLVPAPPPPPSSPSQHTLPSLPSSQSI